MFHRTVRVRSIPAALLMRRMLRAVTSGLSREIKPLLTARGAGCLEQKQRFGLGAAIERVEVGDVYPALGCRANALDVIGQRTNMGFTQHRLPAVAFGVL